MSKDNDVVATDEAAPLVFAVQGDPQRIVYRDDADGRVRLGPACATHVGLEKETA